MRKRTIALILCLGGSLLGCSSKPSDSDIATGATGFWNGCAKVSNVKKTNGVEYGNVYRVSYTYQLETLEDGGGMLGTPPNCSLSILNPEAGQAAALLKISFGSGPIKKGDVFTVSAKVNMVKSEKGWVFQ